MAFIYNIGGELAERIRTASRTPALASVVVYDADFPVEVGQQFVFAALYDEVGAESDVSLLDPSQTELSIALHEAAAEVGESVKFCLQVI